MNISVSLRNQVRAGALVVTFLVTGPAHAGDLKRVLGTTGSNLKAFCEALFTTPTQLRERRAATQLAIETKVQTRLGYLPRVEYLDDGREDGVPQVRVVAYGLNDERLGELPVRVFSPTHLRMGLVKIYGDDLKRKGLSELMFARLMREHPRTLRVSTHLTFDNKKAVLAEVAKGVPCVEAVMLSPAARMRAHFGFTRLLAEPTCHGTIELVLGR